MSCETGDAIPAMKINATARDTFFRTVDAGRYGGRRSVSFGVVGVGGAAAALGLLCLFCLEDMAVKYQILSLSRCLEADIERQGYCGGKMDSKRTDVRRASNFLTDRTSVGIFDQRRFWAQSAEHNENKAQRRKMKVYEMKRKEGHLV